MINFKTWLIQTLRRASYRFPNRSSALASARVSRGLYTCAKCNQQHKAKEVQVDHVTPVIDPHIGFVNWDVYISRMFPEVSGFQVLCKPCHDIKTKEENVIRKEKKS